MYYLAIGKLIPSKLTQSGYFEHYVQNTMFYTEQIFVFHRNNL